MGSQRAGHEWVTFTLFSLPWGSWKRALCPLTLVPQGLNYNPYLLNRRRERENTTHHLTHTPNSNYKPKQPATPPQTLHSRWASLLLHSNPFQEYPVFTSSPSTSPGFSAFCTLASHLEPASWVTNTSWFQIKQQLSVGSPSHLHWADLSFLRSPPCLLLSFLVVHCVSPLLASSLSFLNIKASKRFWSWSLNMPHSLWAILSIFTDSTTTFSVKNTLVPFQVSPSNTRL